MLAVLCVTVILLYFVDICWKRYKHLQLREELGLKGPPTNFLFGNLKEFFDRPRRVGYDDGVQRVTEWVEAYGKTYGAYLGRYLEITSVEPEFAREIYIKQFGNFTDRCITEVFRQNGISKSLLEMSGAEGWKDVRSCMSPQFSTGKMRMMHETIKGKIDVFLDILSKKAISNQKFNIYDDLQALTMEVIAKVAFAIESNCQTDRQDLFYVNSQEMFRLMDIKTDVISAVSFAWPEFDWLWAKLYHKFSPMADAERPLMEGLSSTYDNRKTGFAAHSVDILQLLLNKENIPGNSNLTKDEVIQNCFAFLLAGYETTSTALAYTSHLLAKHPEVQKKLYEEIMETKRTKGLSYESVHEMKYLDCVFKESLRVCPPVAFFMGRECVQDTVVNGIRIPKGTWVNVPPYLVHHLEDVWPNANEFIPERFLDWNSKNDLTWIPFGIGPRNCVGMRFAEMEYKMVVARMIADFELVLPPEEKDLIGTVVGVLKCISNGHSHYSMAAKCE